MDRKEYKSPSVVEYGSLEDLTLGAWGFGIDCLTGHLGIISGGDPPQCGGSGS